MNNIKKSEVARQISVKSKLRTKIWKPLKLLHKKTVYFIGEITVKIDSRGIYSLENINYHDAYLNIPARLRESRQCSQHWCSCLRRVQAGIPAITALRSVPSSSSQFRSSGRSQQSADKAEV